MYYYQHKGVSDFQRTLSHEELQRFFSVITEEEDYTFFVTQYALGLRIGECCQILLKHLDFDNSTIELCPFKQHKKKPVRHLSNIPSNVLDLLRAYVSKYHVHIQYNNGYVFHSRVGKTKGPVSVATMTKRFCKYRKLAGLDQGFQERKDGTLLYHVRSHTLRATSINRVLEATGGDMIAGMSHSRHHSIKGFQSYLEAYNVRKLRPIQEEAFKNTPIKDIVIRDKTQKIFQ